MKPNGDEAARRRDLIELARNSLQPAPTNSRNLGPRGLANVIINQILSEREEFTSRVKVVVTELTEKLKPTFAEKLTQSLEDLFYKNEDKKLKARLFENTSVDKLVERVSEAVVDDMMQVVTSFLGQRPVGSLAAPRIHGRH